MLYAHGCLLAGEGYSTDPVPLNILAGESTQSFLININDSDIVECNETFNITIVSVTTCGATIGSNRSTEVTIIDDDGMCS